MSEPDQTIPHVPFRLVLFSVAGLWLCYFVVVTMRSTVMGLDFVWPLLWRRLLVTAISIAGTLALWPLVRVMAARSFWAQAAAISLVALPGSIALAAINYAVFSNMDGNAVTTITTERGVKIRQDASGDLLIDVPTQHNLPEPPAPPLPVESPESPGTMGAISIHKTVEPGDMWDQIADLALVRYFLLLAWAAIYLALANAEQARAAERREGEFRRAAQAAELRSLRYQINPHFLFNTLNSLSALVLTRRFEAAEKMIQTLSAFYRRSLVDDPTGELRLAEEIVLQRLYLDIEAVRFPERLRTRIEVSEALGDVLVPGMILQPLIENSVKYGVAASSRPVTIEVIAAAEGDMLVLTVRDDGPNSEAHEAVGCGIGLANVRDRLLARFGTAASVVPDVLPEGGFRTVIRMPLRRSRD